MRIGITGTQRGASRWQVTQLMKLIKRGDELHHGDCIGVDEQAHDIAIEAGARIVIHPPTNPEKRAFCEGADHLHDPKPYLERNRDIVKWCELLIVVPEREEGKNPRSGTWWTKRYAERRGKKFIVIERSPS